MERQDRYSKSFLDSIKRVEKELSTVIAQMKDITEDIAKCSEAKSDVKEKLHRVSAVKSKIETTNAHVSVLWLRTSLHSSTYSLFTAPTASFAAKNRKLIKYKTTCINTTRSVGSRKCAKQTHVKTKLCHSGIEIGPRRSFKRSIKKARR